MATLHRRLEIDLDSYDVDHPIFRADRAVHKHVRELVVVSHRMSFGHDRSALTSIWSKKFTRLLECMPKNKLESLCTPQQMQIPPEVLDVISARQQKLEYIQLGPIEHKSADGPYQLAALRLRNLRAIEIPARIGSQEDLRFYGTLLGQNPSIKGLSIQTHLGQTLNGYSTGLQPHTGDHFSSVVGPIFNNIPKDLLPLNLEKLLLHNQRLFNSERTVTPYISFEHLVQLQIHDCKAAGEMLSALEKTFRDTGSALKLFSLHKYTSTMRIDRVASLERFLESFSGLQYLEIRWDDEIAPFFNTSCLERHLPTPRDLCLSFMDDEDHEYKHNWLMRHEDVQSLIQKAPHLRQLAVALADAYPRDLDTEGALGPVLETILSHSQKFLNWPTHDSWRLGTNMGWSREQVDEVANRIMRYLARHSYPSALRLLVFGDWRPYDEFRIADTMHDGEIEESVCYFPGTQTNCFGRTETVAIKIAPSKVRYEYPFWDVESSTYADESYLGAGDYNILGRIGPLTGGRFA